MKFFSAIQKLREMWFSTLRSKQQQEKLEAAAVVECLEFPISCYFLPCIVSSRVSVARKPRQALNLTSCVRPQAVPLKTLCFHARSSLRASSSQGS